MKLLSMYIKLKKAKINIMKYVILNKYKFINQSLNLESFLYLFMKRFRKTTIITILSFQDSESFAFAE